jgi:hypothetical protein
MAQTGEVSRVSSPASQASRKPVQKSWGKEAERLADILGDHHDLAVLRQAMQKEREEFEPACNLKMVFQMMDRRKRELEQHAFRLGGLLFAEKPKRLVRRFETYWKVSHD